MKPEEFACSRNRKAIDGMDGAKKRRRATAVQDLAEMRNGPANAKRLGVRQSSGALERGNGKSERSSGRQSAHYSGGGEV